jgi:hypothetical protein
MHNFNKRSSAMNNNHIAKNFRHIVDNYAASGYMDA